jgi:hypothetical protein
MLGNTSHTAGRLGEATSSFERARELTGILLPKAPGLMDFQRRLAIINLNLGALLGATRCEVKALESFPQTRQILEFRLGQQRAVDLYNLAFVYSLESALLGRSQRTGGPQDRIENQKLADLAVSALRRAVLAGWKDARRAKRDPDLDPLRSRSDFEALILDMAFPAQPIAH